MEVLNTEREVALVAHDGNARLAAVLSGVGVRFKRFSEGAPNPSALVIAFESADEAHARECAFRALVLSPRCVTVLLCVDCSRAPKLLDEDGLVTLSVGLPHHTAAPLLRVALRAVLPVQACLRLSRELLESGYGETLELILPLLEGGRRGVSVKSSSARQLVSRWTLRRRAMVVAGTNPSQILAVVKGVLALELHCSDRVSLRMVAATLGAADARTVRRWISAAVGREWRGRRDSERDSAADDLRTAKRNLTSLLGRTRSTPGRPVPTLRVSRSVL
jgi:hypothetical protein